MFLFRKIVDVGIAIYRIYVLVDVSMYLRFSIVKAGPDLLSSRKNSSNGHLTSYTSTFFGGKQKRNPLANTNFLGLCQNSMRVLENDIIIV